MLAWTKVAETSLFKFMRSENSILLTLQAKRFQASVTTAVFVGQIDIFEQAFQHPEKHNEGAVAMINLGLTMSRVPSSIIFSLHHITELKYCECCL